MPAQVLSLIENRCFDCHSGSGGEGGLDLESLGFDLTQPEVHRRWTLIHDRIRDGEMPPPDDGVPVRIVPAGWSHRAAAALADGQSPPALPSDDPDYGEAASMLVELAGALIDADGRRISETGRSVVRRMNRYEYENTVRSILDSPWLRIAESLPEDGIDHLFPKSGERLDTSHVQVSRYLAAAEQAVRTAVATAAHPSKTEKFYARTEPTLQGYLHYRFGQMAATRSIMPLVDLTPEPDVIRKTQPLTVGDEDPEKREREAMGVFSGVYSATTKYDFTRMKLPVDGHYRLRFKTYSFMAGPNGADGGDDHGLTGGKRAWWKPDRNVALPAERSEPVTLYALSPGGDSRWLTTFDSTPEPTVFECVVPLSKGEGIRPDATRLVRTRPGWAGNPNASERGVPGLAINWLEVEGPLHQSWPPPSYRAIFDDLPFEPAGESVKAVSDKPGEDARRLLTRFYQRAVPHDQTPRRSAEPFVKLFEHAQASGFDFTESMIAATSAILCSPAFLYFDTPPGPLPDHALNQRLAYFLWNGPPDSLLPLNARDETESIVETADRMLDDPRREQFVNSFLDYWLDLRDLNANTPDAELYPEYYLDEQLTESSLRETRMFFNELIERDLPVRNLVDSDFAFVNERLAEHYGLEPFEGINPRRVDLPENSPYGGLITQASVLRVTANGTTTSPVIRGAWVMERIVGIEIPPPPSGVEAVEPDIRGATTIREQLDKHRAIESCNACHARFDPAGFALESFDIAGGFRDRYRATGSVGDSVKGFGKNGHAFKFKLAQPVQCEGTLLGGESFEDIRGLKQLLAAEERQLARNLVHRLVAYGSGAPVSFRDRGEVEDLLDQAAENGYGVRTLIRLVAASDMFRIK